MLGSVYLAILVSKKYVKEGKGNGSSGFHATANQHSTTYLSRPGPQDVLENAVLHLAWRNVSGVATKGVGGIVVAVQSTRSRAFGRLRLEAGVLVGC